jgi:hypothetical protein
MKKFLQIYLGGFIAIPLAVCLAVYLIGCFLTWGIILLDIQWGVVRGYLIISLIFAFFLSIDE